jgi:hypothetical protein
MVSVISFQEAIQVANDLGSKPHLLLGNGFSIACRPEIFIYQRLFEQAKFKDAIQLQELFTRLRTSDFEKVIKALRDSIHVAKAYRPDDKEFQTKLLKDAEYLKDLLVETIAGSHPALPSEIRDEEYQSCFTFLSSFKTLYTVNYDLLLYWTVMHCTDGTGKREQVSFEDGFSKPEDDWASNYVTWQGDKTPNLIYLHGALHLFDTGTEVKKITWNNTGTALIEQIRSALNENAFPVFVAEGESDAKLERIKHNEYLSRSRLSFKRIKGSLFVFGHSFADNDKHFLNLIERGKLQALFVGLHGNPNSQANRAIVGRAEMLQSARPTSRPLALYFYDTESADVWGHSSTISQSASNF